MSKTTTAEPLAGLQGQGGDCGYQGRSDDRSSLPEQVNVHPNQITTHGRRSSKAARQTCLGLVRAARHL